MSSLYKSFNDSPSICRLIACEHNQDTSMISINLCLYIFSLFGNLLSAWFDVIHTQNTCRLK